MELVPAPPRFHARHDALSRAYFYQISTRKNALAKRYVWWIKEPLDVPAMQQAAALLPGRHDFAAFRAPDPSKPGESTIVVVDAAEVGVDGPMIVFRIEASHFLWKMVRRLAGTLVKIGKGDVTVSSSMTCLAGSRGMARLRRFADPLFRYRRLDRSGLGTFSGGNKIPGEALNCP